MAPPQNAPQAARARQILQQCKDGLNELRNDPRVTWFVLWSGTLCLLRTVGDALEKDADIRIQKAQIRWFQKMKLDNAAAGRGSSVKKHGNTWEPAIFWQFIRRDRNLLLHEAQLTAQQNVMLRLQGAAVVISAAGQAPPPPQPPAPPPSPIYSYPMSTPPYTGRDSRDVVEEAIQWWQEQIDQIEQDAK